jgi:hypothetical protein
MGMFDKVNEKISELKEKALEAMKGGSAFDPASLNDEVATMTKWTPAKGGGTNIGTHSLKIMSSGRVEFKMKKTAFLFPAVFMLAGLGAGIGMTIGGLKKNDMKMLYFGIPFGTIFFLAGFFILRSFMTPRVFDLDIGYYWKGRKSPNMYSKKTEKCQLEDIHAIQVLEEYCRGDKSSYYSYELNLVLKDGSRMNVVDHGKLKLIKEDAQKLAQFLNIPVWDTTS